MAISTLEVIRKKAKRCWHWLTAPERRRTLARQMRRAFLAARDWTHRTEVLHSLRWRLTLVILVVAAAILMITYASLSRSASHAASEEARRQATHLANHLSAAVGEAVAAGDRMQIHVFAQSMLKNGVCAVSVLGKDGALLFSSHAGLEEETSGAALEKAQPEKVGPEAPAGATTAGAPRVAWLKTSAPVRFGNTPVGVISIWLDRTKLERSIQKSHAFVYPIITMGFVVLLCLSIAVLHAPFRALGRLRQITKRVGDGDLTVEVPARGKDEVSNLCVAFGSMVTRLSTAREEIQAKHLETIQAMISVVEARDSYTRGHCQRVQGYARRILAKVPDINAEDRALYETAALLHDVGKIGIPDKILLKQDRLTPEEIEAIRSHVTIGENILGEIEAMRDVARWVRHHHERWDGFGYPDGLRERAIPFASRVIALADSIDAMLTKRPYRDALSPERAVSELRDGSGAQFDPELVPYAVELVEDLTREKEEAVVDQVPSDA